MHQALLEALGHRGERDKIPDLRQLVFQWRNGRQTRKELNKLGGRNCCRWCNGFQQGNVLGWEFSEAQHKLRPQGQKKPAL